jgi:hypothetical protein
MNGLILLYFKYVLVSIVGTVVISLGMYLSLWIRECADLRSVAKILRLIPQGWL